MAGLFDVCFETEDNGSRWAQGVNSETGNSESLVHRTWCDGG